jgi:hypothetical protein
VVEDQVELLVLLQLQEQLILEEVVELDLQIEHHQQAEPAVRESLS